MEILPKPPIVPSNAPPLSSPGGKSSSRILQEVCINRQQDQEEYSEDRKPLSSSPKNEYNSIGTSPVDTRHHANGARAYDRRRERNYDEEFTRLWRRLQKSEGYLKYRKRQPTEDSDRESKWPDQMEIAFFRALVRFEPMGRRKIRVNPREKPRGRNELIADYITKITGKPRTRKEVSSHIQVLKPYVRNDIDIMKYMTKDTHHGRRSGYSPRAVIDSGALDASELLQKVTNSHDFPDSTGLLWGNDSGLACELYKSCTPNPTPRCFRMYVQAQDSTRRLKVLHTYTEFRDFSKLEDIKLDEVSHWKGLFPPLSSIIARSTRNMEILLFDASLNLYLEDMPTNSELCIKLDFACGQRFKQNQPYECRTRFYHSGVPMNCVEKTSIQAVGEAEHCEEGEWTRLIPFRSRVWAHQLYHLAKRFRESGQTPYNHNMAGSPHPGSRHNAIEKVREHIRGITAVQEVYIKLKDNRRSQPIFVILWMFRQANNEQDGETTWRRISTSSAESELEFHPQHFLDLPYSHTEQNVEAIASSTQSFNSHSYGMVQCPSAAGLSSMSTEAATPSHSMSTGVSQDIDGLDFTGGHINITMDTSMPLHHEMAMPGLSVAGGGGGVPFPRDHHHHHHAAAVHANRALELNGLCDIPAAAAAAAAAAPQFYDAQQLWAQTRQWPGYVQVPPQDGYGIPGYSPDDDPRMRESNLSSAGFPIGAT